MKIVEITIDSKAKIVDMSKYDSFHKDHTTLLSLEPELKLGVFHLKESPLQRNKSCEILCKYLRFKDEIMIDYPCYGTALLYIDDQDITPEIYNKIRVEVSNLVKKSKSWDRIGEILVPSIQEYKKRRNFAIDRMNIYKIFDAEDIDEQIYFDFIRILDRIRDIIYDLLHIPEEDSPAVESLDKHTCINIQSILLKDMTDEMKVIYKDLIDLHKRIQSISLNPEYAITKFMNYIYEIFLSSDINTFITKFTLDITNKESIWLYIFPSFA